MGTRSQSRPGNGRNVTVEDVAREARVSRATASRVVNQNPRVSPAARARVIAAIESLGYVPNRAARSLMTRRSDSVGVVILGQAAVLFSDPFYGHLLLGISGELAERDLQLILLLAATRTDEARVERYLEAGHVDGAVIVGPHGDDPMPAGLVRGGVPVVLSGRPLSANRISYVDADNRDGARLAVRHLIAGGRRTIATIHGTLDLSSASDRLEGYRDALREGGLAVEPALEAAGDFNAAQAAEAMRSLLALRPDLDAVFVASDSMASAAIGVLRDEGRRVPEDVAVVGFDDSPVAAATRPRLTTVRQPIEAMGRELARLLVQQILDPGSAPSQVVFPTELIVRDSSLPA